MDNYLDNLLSFVIPIKNEQDSIEPLVEQLNAAVRRLNNRCSAEYILIDDGSTDRSWEVINQLIARSGNLITAIRLR